MVVSGYRRYFSGLLLGFFLILILWIGLVRMQMGVPTESSRWTSEIIRIKLATARSKRSPKIVLLSGSSAHFGVSAAQIEHETSIPTVNMGTHAGLDLAYILHLGKQVAKPGDFILMPLEYELYATNGKPSEVLLDYVFSRDPDYLRSLSLQDQASFYLALSGWDLLVNLKTRFRPSLSKISSAPITPETYDSSTVDRNSGDETMNRRANRTSVRKSMVQSEVPLPLLTKSEPDERIAWNEIAKFAAWCRQNRITLVATYPLLLTFKDYQSPSTQSFFSHLSEQYRHLHITVLGTPWELMRTQQAFFDTRYHPLDEVRKSTTQERIRQLMPLLHARMDGNASKRRASGP